MREDLNISLNNPLEMRVKKAIYATVLVILILFSTYFLIKVQLVSAVITLVLLFLITFFKREFYDLLKDIGL